MPGDIILLVPDGVGVRNFVIGPFLAQACARRPVHVLHAIPEAMLPTYGAALNGSVLTGSVQWQGLRELDERPLSFLLRNSLSYAQMYWVDSFPMRVARSLRSKGSWRTRTALAMARWTGRAAAAPRRIRLLDRLHTSVVSRFPEVERYRRLFAELRPAVLFCSHQRPPEILPPVLAARALGIPTASFIFSWDNITSKGRIAAPFDHFLVWSEQMRGELLRYYPDVVPARVHIVGTPQFDPYANPRLHCSREEFFRWVGADPRRPLICFSGGDAGNAPEDPQHVSVLMEHIRSGRIRGNPQVLLRPSPVDNGTRYQGVRRTYPELLYAAPAWTSHQAGAWEKVVPLPEDVRFLTNLTRHADLNVNLASTMTLDFAIHDKPVVNVAFDVSHPPVYYMPMWEYVRQFEHYQPVDKLGAARCARTAEELAEHVNAYLDDPSLDREGRRRFVALEVGVPIGQSTSRILEVLEGIAS